MYKKALIGLVLISSIFGMALQPASAAGTLYVGTTDTNEAVTYDTIENAVQNASDGDTIEVASGEYSESIDVTTNNVTLNRYASETSGTVTLNATNVEYGYALYGEHSHNVTIGTNVELVENTVTVDPANTANADTYGTIQNAANNTAENTTIEIAPGTYNESVNVTSANLGVVNNAPDTGDVTIDATNTTRSQAFYGPEGDSVRIGSEITVKESVLGIGGGSIGDAAMSTFMGIPIWAIGVVVVLVGYVYYEESD